MQIQLTQHQAIVLLVTVNREIRSEQETLRKTTSPVLRDMVEESIREKRQIARAIDQAVNNVVINLTMDGGVTVTEGPTA